MYPFLRVKGDRKSRTRIRPDSRRSHTPGSSKRNAQDGCLASLDNRGPDWSKEKVINIR